MATLPELLAQAEIIRTAQNVDENTAQRIGKLYNDIIVYFSNNDSKINEEINNLQNIIDEKIDYRQIGGEDLDGICQSVNRGAKNGNYSVRLENSFHGQDDLYLEVLDINQDKTLLDSYYIHRVYLKDGTIYSRTAHFYTGNFLEFTTDWIKEIDNTEVVHLVGEEINKLLPLIYAGL